MKSRPSETSLTQPVLSPLSEPVTLGTPSGSIVWGNAKQWNLFAGPDVIEDEGLLLETAKEIQTITSALQIPWILKVSFDKANRTSGQSYRGPGLGSGLKVLKRVKAAVGCAILTDVHETQQVESVAEVADVLQIPAFLCRQTDLVVAAARTGRVLHIKKGQFMAPWDMKTVVAKAKSAGNSSVLLCERGTTFGYNRLINDMTGLVEMRRLGCPVIMDATHSTQLPGASGTSSDGRADMIPVLARAAMAVGIDGLFLETHPDPAAALCDGPSSLPLKELSPLLQQLQRVWSSVQTRA
jgi:2-dehydro-3-deoxyphosphooctonate aldolase (KDO 8-P synthase)